MLSSYSLLIALSARLAFFAAAAAAAAPSSPANLNTRQTAAATAANDCASPTGIVSSPCWDTLDIPAYLTDWNRSVPVCPANSGDASACCRPAEPWTTCFLRLAYDAPGSDCATLDAQTCALSRVSPGLDPSTAPKAEYVVWSIVGINALFSTYNQGKEGRRGIPRSALCVGVFRIFTRAQR